uniref:Cleavage and polyadenylation specificity factor subunit 3 n=2 Tax=Rhodosorus marinus TaxID=101924 RepID=A0A7S3A919_9RHOD
MAEPVKVYPPGGGGDILEVIPLGAGSEVGRSCCLVKYRGKSVLFDCGVHPAYSGLASLPFFDAIDADEIDLALITHFHLDHCAGLPYLLERTNFNPKARIFMTHPTKAIYKALLSDFVRVSSHSTSSEENLYNEQDILKTMERIESLDYHQEMTVNGIRFWAYNAGHVLGAAMFMIEIAGVRVLYTGDFSRQEDRHLKEAEIPPYKPDVLIVESTYGVQVHEPRKIRESRFTQKVAQAVRRGGRVLLPVFALGRAQELLLILDEFWEAHPDLQEVPIYYASMLAKRCMTVYQTYINMMNDNVKKRYDVSNPFAFKYVSNLRGMDQFDDSQPCVIMASPGMLQSGLSRELFERWCTDKRNACIIPGYCVDGTLAKHILTEPTSISRASDGKELPLRCSVDYITFSAHSDFLQTSQFIDQAKPTNIVLVHGESNEMGRLRLALEDRYNKGSEGHKIKIFTPKNTQAVQLEFHGERIGKAIGVLPKRKPENGLEISSVIIRQDFNHTLVKQEDLSTYTNIKISKISQKLVVPIRRSFTTLTGEVVRTFGGVETGVSKESSRPYFTVGRGVSVEPVGDGLSVAIKWLAGYKADMIADSIASICISMNDLVEKDPVTFELDDDYYKRSLEVSRKMLASRFGTVLGVEGDKNKSRLVLDLVEVVVDHHSGEVECEDELIRERVRMALRRIQAAVFPIPDYYCDCCACSTMDNTEPDQKKVKVEEPADKDAKSEGKRPTGPPVDSVDGVKVKQDEEKVQAKTEILDYALGTEASIQGSSEGGLQEAGMKVGELGQGLQAKDEPLLDTLPVKEEPKPVDTPTPVDMDVVKDEPA